MQPGSAGGAGWYAIGLTLLALLLIGFISANAQRIAIYIAVLIALVIVLRKWNT